MSWFDRIFRTPSDPSPGRAATPVGFEAVAEVVLPAVLAERTQASLREAGSRGNEGLVVWSGVQNASTFAVKSVSVPRQRGIQTAEGVCVVVDGNSLHEVNVATFGRGERLFAQVHSHPGRAYHSPMDDRYAVVTSPGCLSLVVPDFAVATLQCRRMRRLPPCPRRQVGRCRSRRRRQAHLDSTAGAGMMVANFFDRSLAAAMEVLRGADPAAFRSRLSRLAVALSFDRSAVMSSEGRVALEMATDLIARFYPGLALIPLDAAAETAAFADILKRAARSIHPGIELRPQPAKVVYRLVAGATAPSDGGACAFFGSQGWTALVDDAEAMGCLDSRQPVRGRGSGVPRRRPCVPVRLFRRPRRRCRRRPGRVRRPASGAEMQSRGAAPAIGDRPCWDTPRRSRCHRPFGRLDAVPGGGTVR